MSKDLDVNNLQENNPNDWFAKWLSDLPEQHQKIIYFRYGIEEKSLTLEQISQKFGMTRERARQIQEKSLKQLSTTSYYNKFIRPLSDYIEVLVYNVGGLL